jgi:four helix bundle protein
MAGHYKDLIAWQKSMDLVEEVYRLTDAFPRREIYSLVDQLRRAAVSVPSNIAEGQAHHSRREFCHFLQHARGSLAEIETQLLIAIRLKYLTGTAAAPVLKRVAELGRILNGLVASLQPTPQAE